MVFFFSFSFFVFFFGVEGVYFSFAYFGIMVEKAASVSDFVLRGRYSSERHLF